MWNEAADGEYSLNIVLSDSCLFGGTTLYGEPDDGEYDWLYYSVVSDGNVHPLRMLQLAPVIPAYEPVTVSISTAYNPETGKQDVFCKINDHVYELTEAVDTQLTGQEYYFSAAAYADGANEATASFMMTDICGETPDTFAGYEHECSTYREEAPTCGANGRKICAECAAVISTTPATGNHNWDDATCTEPKICSVCDATEGEAAGHSFTDFCCTVCGEAEGAAVINGTNLYDDLAAAFDAAVAGDTVVLLADIIGTTSYTVDPQQNITVDLNGHTLRNTEGNTLVIEGANVTINGTDGGTICSDEGIAITIKKGGNVTICDAITVQCGSNDSDHVFSLEDTSTATINTSGGRYYKDPTSAGVKLSGGLAISGSGTNWTVIEDSAECSHEWGEWTVTLEPDVGAEGSQERTCTLCGEVETETIPALEEPDVPAAKDYKITFDPDGGKMPDGVPSEMGINYNENYKEATGYDFPVPIRKDYKFEGWLWESGNHFFNKGDWDTGYYQVPQDIHLIALWSECWHSFIENGICTDCGLLDVSLSGTTLTLLGNIGVNFYLEIHEAIRSAEDAYVELTCDKKTTRIPVNTPSGEDESGTYYTCEVNAKQMSETITVKVVMGAYESGTFTYSVKENAAVILENKNNNEAYTKAQNVVTAMLHYGAYAQTYFGYNTDNLANEELGAQDLFQANFTGFSVTGTEVEGIGTFVGANLVLESETTLKVYFEPAEGVIPEFAVTSAAINPVAYEVTSSDGRYVIAIQNIPAQHLDADFTITVKGTTETFTISALDYCGNVVSKSADDSDLYGDNTADLVNLLKSMRLYNQAAEAYFAVN